MCCHCPCGGGKCKACAADDRRRIAKLEKFIRGEYEILLHSVCPVVDGTPDRSQVDRHNVSLVRSYERILGITSDR